MRPPTDRPVEETLGELDDEVAAAVAALPSDVTPGLGDIDAMRAFIAGSLALASPSAGDDVVREDRLVPRPSGSAEPAHVPVRIYRPRTPAGRGGRGAPRSVAEGARPGLVWCHGGGFVFGDLEVADQRCARFSSDLGAVVVSVDYRLAPEHPFPAAVEDAFQVTRWVAEHARELGTDPARLVVGGSSSGATLAAAVALMARDRGGPGLALQVLLQPALDDRCDTPSSRAVVDPRVFHREVQREMWDHYLGAAGARGPVSAYAAPARAEDLAGLPPAVIVTAEHDPLRDEGRAYAARLRRAGVATELIHAPGTVHGFEELAPQAAVSRRTHRAVMDAVAGILAP